VIETGGVPRVITASGLPVEPSGTRKSRNGQRR
jgi:hypothetical protein